MPTLRNGKRLYDSKTDKHITTKQAISYISRAVNNFYSGNQSNALYGFYHKTHIFDIFDNSYYAGYGKHEIIFGLNAVNIYDKNGNFKQLFNKININVATYGGYWTSAGFESIGYTKDGRKILSLYIADKDGNRVLQITGTEEELTAFLAQFGRTLTNADVRYNEKGNLVDTYPFVRSEEDNKNEREAEKKKKDNFDDTSWYDGWGAENRESPR